VSGTLRAVALKRGVDGRQRIGAGTMRISTTDEESERGNHLDPVRTLQTSLKRSCDAQTRLLTSLIDKQVFPQRSTSPYNRKSSP
jgi:hypothetical protein